MEFLASELAKLRIAVQIPGTFQLTSPFILATTDQ